MHREVEDLRREHARLQAEHATLVALREQREAQLCWQHVQLHRQHAQHFVSTCRWPAAVCDLVIAAHMHVAIRQLGLPHNGGIAAHAVWERAVLAVPVVPWHTDYFGGHR